MPAALLGMVSQVFCIIAMAAGAVVLVIRWFTSTDKATGLQAKDAQRWMWRRIALFALAIVGSRLAVFGVGALAQWIVKGEVSTLQSTWGRWDAHHYLYIAEHGYTADRSLGDGWLYIVFFPLFPALTALLGRLLGGAFFQSGVLVSWVALFFTCLTLYRLAETEERGSGGRSVKYLLIFPFTLFLGIPYTESLFLLLTALGLYAIRRHHWVWAGVLGLLAALTRNVGVLLCVPFFVELTTYLGTFLGTKKINKAFWGALFRFGWPVFLMPLGTCIYLAINYFIYGDALIFMEIQSSHWSQNMQWFFQSIATTVRQLLAGNTDTNLFLWGPQLIMMVGSLIALPFMAKRLRPMYGAYLLVYLIVILSPSWLLSYGRYYMGAVPVFLYLGSVSRRKWVDVLLTVLMAAAAIYLTAGFALGYQVL